MKRGLIYTFSLILALAFNLSAQDGRHQFRSTEGNFTLTLPCTPELNPISIMTAGKLGTAHQFVCLSEDGLIYMGTYADFPPGFDKRAQLKLERDGYVQGFHPSGGTVVSERVIRSGEGLEIRTRGTINNGEHTVSVMRFFFVGNRLYGFGIGKIESNTVQMQENTYFTSFKLLNERVLTGVK